MAARDTSWVNLVGKRLRKESEVIALEDLPRRWVDLIHYLDEQERKRGP